MTNNLKFMLLGIFLAVMSVGGFVIADEEEFFFVIAITLSIMAVWAFAKGFIDNREKHTTGEYDEKSSSVTQTQSTVTEQQK